MILYKTITSILLPHLDKNSLISDIWAVLSFPRLLNATRGALEGNWPKCHLRQDNKVSCGLEQTQAQGLGGDRNGGRHPGSTGTVGEQ